MSADFDRCASVTRCAPGRRTLRIAITSSSYARWATASSPGGSGKEQDRHTPLRPRGIGHHSGNDAMIIKPAGRCQAPARWMGWRQDEDGGTMTDRTYRVTEIVGTSAEGIEPAIRNALH